MENKNPSKIELNDEKIEAIAKNISGNLGSAPVERAELADGLVVSSTQTEVEVKNNSSEKQNVGRKTEIPNIKIKNLRTFQGDAAEAIEKQNESVLTIALAEKKKQQKEEVEKPRDPETRKNIITVVASIILIALGTGTIIFLYKTQKNAPVKTIQIEQEKTIVPFNYKIPIDLTSSGREKLLDFVMANRQNNGKRVGDITYSPITKKINGTEKEITTQEFLSTINSKASGPLIRAFGEKMMFGFYSANVNEPFLLISLTSFENAFDGMLKWEKDLNGDLGIFFSRRSIQLSGSENATSTATSTEIVNFDAPAEKFIDETIKNKDARILKSTHGDVILLYSFLDKDTLLIAPSETVLQGMIDKLIAQKLIR